MKVGLFSDTFLPIVDGVGRVVSHYAQGLGECCEACYVITPRQAHPGLPRCYEVVAYGSVSLPTMKQYRVGLPTLDRSYRRRLSKLEMDLVHAHSPFIAGREAWKYAHRQQIPLVGTFHSKYYDDFLQVTKSKTLSRLCLRSVLDFYARCDEVWAVSSSTADVLRGYGFQGSIEVMENGTDAQEVDQKTIDLVDRRYSLQGKPVLLFVGQMNWKKNIRRVLESAQSLLEQGREFRLVMAGQGPSEREIRELCTTLGLESVVIFTGPISEPQILLALYARADLFVFPSLYDNAPMVVREAAAVGTPSLLARGSSAAEVIEDGVNGLLAEDTTVNVAERIAWAFDHPGELREMGKQAQKTIPKPWKDILPRVLERYEGLIASKKQ
ncbi:MAG: glycosyltransferase family 4 protein [Firmicutes bacterium]|nr:glycosyltransferase family 4 protein [Bacillota bacterium]